MSFIIEEIADEILVYDTENHTAHCLDAAAQKRWFATKTDAARRKFLLSGAVGVLSMLAPLAAEAASTPCLATCRRGDFGKECSTGDGKQCNGRCFDRRCIQ